MKKASFKFVEVTRPNTSQVPTNRLGGQQVYQEAHPSQLRAKQRALGFPIQSPGRRRNT